MAAFNDGLIIVDCWEQFQVPEVCTSGLAT